MFSGDLIWLLLIGGFAYLMMRGGGGCCGGHSHDSHGGTPAAGNTSSGGCCGSGGNSSHDVGGEDAHQHNQQKEGLLGRLGGHQMKPEGSPPPLPSASDPVCGMEVSTITSGFVSEFQGGSYYFCSEKCKKLFDIHPGRYI